MKKVKCQRDILIEMLITLLVFIIVPIFYSCSEEKSARPNILFIVTDDQSYPHAGVYESTIVATPAFDYIAENGILFHQAYASAPSCAPSRASILTGKPFYLTEDASMNHGFWDEKLVSFQQILEKNGYQVGFTGKGWGPGKYLLDDMDNPAGHAYNDKTMETPGPPIKSTDYAANFEVFLKQRSSSDPFCFWVGTSEPHRPLVEGIGLKNGKKLESVRVPDYYPDLDVIRSDILDYAYEIEWVDKHVLRMIKSLETENELQNTIIIFTSDHGMSFPRAKTTVYDAGVRVPLAVMWKDRIQPGREVNDFVNLYDLAPTFLELAGIQKPKDMVGKSIIDILNSSKSGLINTKRTFVITGLERHGGIRTGEPDYPMRSYRTKDYLFIKNYEPTHPPAGPYPGLTWPRNGPVGGYGYIDGSPTKTAVWMHRNKFSKEFELCMEKRPMYELYDVRTDPDQIYNLAYEKEYLELVKEFESKMENILIEHGDPRLLGQTEFFEKIRENIEAYHKTKQNAK